MRGFLIKKDALSFLGERASVQVDLETAGENK